MNIFNLTLGKIGAFLASRLAKESSGYKPYTPSDQDTLRKNLQPGDILLVEGNQFVSGAIKYLTQSTWSHAAFYVGDNLPKPKDGSERPTLIEVNVGTGCTAVKLSKYEKFNTRICRPVGLSKKDKKTTIDFMISKIGLQYDLKNIFDLL